MLLRFFFIKMFIGKPFSDKPDRAWVDVKFGSDVTIGHGFGHCQSLSRLFVCQFPYGYDLPPLGQHIAPIVPFCAKKKMFRIYARRVVALVKNTKLFWNNSESNHPRNAVGRNAATFMSYSVASDSDNAIAKNVRSCDPRPARTKFWTTFWNRTVFANFRPKAFENGFGKALRDEKRERRVCLHTSILSLVELVCRPLARQSAGVFLL